MNDNKVKEIEVIYRENYNKVYNDIYYRVGCKKEVAEDLTSLVFIKVLTYYDSYDKNRASLSTWINCIARNTIIDYFRSSKRETISLDMVELHEDLIVDFEEQIGHLFEYPESLVNKALEKLEKKERELIELKYFLNKTNREIAKQMGVNESTISSQYYRLLRKMKNYIPE